MKNPESVNSTTLNNHERLIQSVFLTCYENVGSLAKSAAAAGTIDGDSDDVAQVVFTRLDRALLDGCFPDCTAENWKSGRRMIRIRAWLFSATLLVTHEFLRKQKRQDAICRNCQCAAGGENRSFRSQLDMLLVDEAREKCTPMEQSVLSMKIDGYSCQEIAEKLGRSSATVRGHLMSARNRIRNWLANDAV